MAKKKITIEYSLHISDDYDFARKKGCNKVLSDMISIGWEIYEVSNTEFGTFIRLKKEI